MTRTHFELTWKQTGFHRSSEIVLVSVDRNFLHGGSSCGNPVIGLGLPRALDLQTQYWIQMASFGQDQLLGSWGGLYQGTNELIGEDLGMIIRLVPVPVMG